MCFSASLEGHFFKSTLDAIFARIFSKSKLLGVRLNLHLQHRCVDRRGKGGNCPPPIPNVAPKIFRVIKLLMRKPKKYFSANQWHCLRNLLHVPLVETDQSTMLHQLPLTNQTMCAWGSENFIRSVQLKFFQVKRRIFVGRAKMVKFYLFHSKVRKQPFFAKNVIGKYQVSKCRKGPRSPSTPPFSTPTVVYIVL